MAPSRTANAPSGASHAAAPHASLFGMGAVPLAWWGAAEYEPDYLYQAQFHLRHKRPWVLAALLVSWLVARLIARARARGTRQPKR